MPLPTRVTQTDSGSTAVVPLDHRSRDFKVGLIVDVTSGTPNYTVQLTGDDIQAAGFSAAAANWQAHSTLDGLTASAKGNLAFPATGLRLTVNSGTGTARLTVIHGGGA